MKFIYAFGLVVCSYLLFKYKQKTQRLLLVHSNNRLSRLFYLINSKFFESFRPSLFLFSGHAQTLVLELLHILMTFFKNVFNFYNFNYKRDIFTLSDGCSLAVDCAIKKNSNSDKSKMNEYKKILIIFPGVTSSSEDYYIKSLVEDFLDEFDCRVLNARGIGGLKLTTPKLISTECYKDVAEYITKTSEENKDKKIFGLGFSFGGMLLARYLGTEPERVPDNFLAGCGLCYPCCLEQAKSYGEFHFNGLYSKVVLKNLKQIFLDNIDVMFDKKHYESNEKLYSLPENKDKILKELSECRLLSDFDKFWTLRMLDYENLSQYYNESKLEKYISRIEIPFFSMFTEDDPIIPINSIPFKTLQNNPNTVTAVTQTGGHLGFFTGVVIPQREIDQPIKTFFKTVEILKDTSNCMCDNEILS
jgi:predicted alpha/beta-fold hydrolase